MSKRHGTQLRTATLGGSLGTRATDRSVQPTPIRQDHRLDSRLAPPPSAAPWPTVWHQDRKDPGVATRARGSRLAATRQVMARPALRTPRRRDVGTG
jgi:hypothetical protein